jgi:hypothetical protein
MTEAAPALFVALEQSSLGAAIRQSVWLYPAANVGHILGLALLAGALAIMDLRLLGVFSSAPPAALVQPARRIAVAAVLLQAGTGFFLFTAEASHLVLNPVFQAKMALVALALTNALVLGRFAARDLDYVPAHEPVPPRLRVAAALSLGLWLVVAAAGRLIAYA